VCLCMCVYVCICLLVHVCICACVSICVSLCVCMYVSVCVHLYLSVCVYVCVCLISYADFKKLHTYKKKAFYVPRVIGQKSVRSLLGCFANKDKKVRFLCAQYLYQVKLNFIHKKVIVKYYKREKYMPAKLALQDVLVVINEQRFAKARKMRDGSFLAKVEFSDISEQFEKGHDGYEFTKKDFKFLKGGMLNTDHRIRNYSIQMIGRIDSPSAKIIRYLKSLKGKVKDKELRKQLNISIKCAQGKKCPDAKINQYE